MQQFVDILSVSFIAVGVFFSLLAAVGILRMPDFYTRIHTATKASTLGVSFIVIAAALEYRQSASTTRAGLIIVFLFVTAPVAAHMVGRAAYFTGVRQWKESCPDEMSGENGGNSGSDDTGTSDTSLS